MKEQKEGNIVEAEKAAIKILKDYFKERIKEDADKEETCMLKDYVDELYHLCQLETNYFKR